MTPFVCGFVHLCKPLASQRNPACRDACCRRPRYHAAHKKEAISHAGVTEQCRNCSQNTPDLGIVGSTLSSGSNGRPQYAPFGTATTPTTHGKTFLRPALRLVAVCPDVDRHPVTRTCMLSMTSHILRFWLM